MVNSTSRTILDTNTLLFDRGQHCVRTAGQLGLECNILGLGFQGGAHGPGRVDQL